MSTTDRPFSWQGGSWRASASITAAVRCSTISTSRTSASWLLQPWSAGPRPSTARPVGWPLERRGRTWHVEQREWTRRLAWEGCVNARDLGGYPTADGRETRWGAVVRSDSPAALTEAGRAALADYGVRAIVDLRLPTELADAPNPFAEPGDHGIAYTNVSFIDPAFAPDAVTTLADDYLQMLDRYRRPVAEAITAVAQASPGAVLVHCAAGKDRTGLVAALLLGLVGVPAETIAADYAMTGEALRPSSRPGWTATRPSGPSARSCWPATPPPPRSCSRSLPAWPTATAGSSPTSWKPASQQPTWTASATACSPRPRRRSAGVVGEQPPAPWRRNVTGRR